LVKGADAPYYHDVADETSNIVNGVAEEVSNDENRGVAQERSNGIHNGPARGGINGDEHGFTREGTNSIDDDNV
jgi:hypothetical protein